MLCAAPHRELCFPPQLCHHSREGDASGHCITWQGLCRDWQSLKHLSQSAECTRCHLNWHLCVSPAPQPDAKAFPGSCCQKEVACIRVATAASQESTLS